MITISKWSNMKKYEQVIQYIKDKIASGEYTVNQKLPNEKQFMEEFECSRATIKRALDSLVSEGLVVKVRGSGTYIKGLQSNDMLKKIIDSQRIGFTKTHANEDVYSKVLEFTVTKPSKYIAKNLNIAENDFVYKIKRVRYASQVPHVIEELYMPINLIHGLTEEILQSSIYSYMKEVLNLSVGDTHRNVRADFPTSEEEKILDTKGKIAILEIEQVNYLDTGQPFEYAVNRFRADKQEIFYYIGKEIGK